MRLAVLALTLAGCGGCSDDQRGGCFTDGVRVATGWQPAERLFRGDPAWRGGDAAFSIDLGGGRVLWLFGDSFVSPTANGMRGGAPFARNTVAVQTGYDPATASMRFSWRSDGGTPSAFFAAPGADTWYWPGPGARLGGVLLVFLWRMSSHTDDPLGFVADAPEAVLVTNPDDDPSAWQLAKVAVPTNAWGAFLGTGAVVVDGGFLYAMSCVEPGNHYVYLARWPVADATAGTLADPEWLTDGGFARQSQLAGAPHILFTGGHTEFSVHFDAATSQWVQVQPLGFPQGEVAMRTAPSLTGPWSSPRVVYHPPEASCAGLLTYAAKAHPELRSPELGGAVAVSYASNSLDLATLVADQALYFPRFVRLDVAGAAAQP